MIPKVNNFVIESNMTTPTDVETPDKEILITTMMNMNMKSD
jgi:hypothetical protein